MEKNKIKTLSVVLPTYNCGKLIIGHISSMQNWLDLADEIIVVDSRSTDGTLEHIKANLHHPNLLIIERDRGLYESWNEAVAQTSGKWVYISTVGDTIPRNHLENLLGAGERFLVDVVISPKLKLNYDNGTSLICPASLNPKIYKYFKGKGIVLLEPCATDFFAFENAKPNSLMGSIAGDLFLGEHLRARPWPVEYGSHGDTAWTLRYGKETRMCLLPIAGSVFSIHPKHSQPNEPINETMGRMYLNESPNNHEALLQKKVAKLWMEKRKGVKRSIYQATKIKLQYLYFRTLLKLNEIHRAKTVQLHTSFHPVSREQKSPKIKH